MRESFVADGGKAEDFIVTKDFVEEFKALMEAKQAAGRANHF
jgi:hypothetical protein